MIVPDVSAAEGKPVDFMGAIKLAGIVVIGLLAIIGFGWEDMLGIGKNSAKPKTETKRAASTEEYEKTYLDEEIDEEAIDRKTGITD